MSQNRKGFETRANQKVRNINEENRTVEVVFATEYPVRRYDWRNDVEFMEVLSFKDEHVNMERITNGVAPVLDSHNSWNGSRGVLGVVESGSLTGTEGIATLRFSKSKDVEDTWEKVRDGILPAVSVGYTVHEYFREAENHENGLPIYRAVNWEPMEVSVAPIPADPNSKGRTESSVEFPILRTIEAEEPPTAKKETPKPTRDAEVNIKRINTMFNLNDLKASRTALEKELKDLNALETRDETQEARFEAIVPELEAVNGRISTKERADALLIARANAGEGELSAEDKEVLKMKKRFSIAGAIKDVLGKRAVSGVAGEWTEHARSQGHEGSGQIMIPHAFMRAGSSDDFQAGSGDGSGFIATEVGGFVEGLMQPLAMESWGMKVLRGLTGNVKYPRESVNADATGEGETDSGAASGLELDDFTLAPNRYYNDTKVSLQLLQTGEGAVDQHISNALRRGHERRLMRDIFTGSTHITGITGISGVTDIAAADGAAYAAIARALEQAVLVNEGLTPGCRYVFSPSAYEYFNGAVGIANIQALIRDGKIGMYEIEKTPYFADASSGVGQVLFGDWSLATLGYFGSVDITIDPYTAKKSGQIEISQTQFADFNLDQPGGFALENGVAVS